MYSMVQLTDNSVYTNIQNKPIQGALHSLIHCYWRQGSAKIACSDLFSHVFVMSVADGMF